MKISDVIEFPPTGTVPERCRLRGFDSAGEVFAVGTRVFRGIYAGHGEMYRRILSVCAAADLFRHGLVGSRECVEAGFHDLPYDLILEHDRVPFISYPHEWAASMLKDAALLHTGLFRTLAPQGLTLKDWHPYNIVFDGTRPVFVDFTSIIPLDELPKQAYLTPPRVPVWTRPIWDTYAGYYYEMYRLMCLPYFLLPLYQMALGQHARARTRMFGATMNTPGGADVLTEEEVFADRDSERRQFRANCRRRNVALVQRGGWKDAFFSTMEREIAALPVTAAASDYADYYAAKGENFAFEPSGEWHAKQRVVHWAVTTWRPVDVLDIGSNTGWFSLLAARNGCRVVSVDVDEACIERLYARAKAEQAPVLPLVLDVTQPSPDVAAAVFDDEPASLIGGDAPLLLHAAARLKCEMALALAIVHHLALGRGLTFDNIAATLDRMTGRYLVVEFVSRDDGLVVGEPLFFHAYAANPQAFEWYTLEHFQRALAERFHRVEVRAGESASRHLLLCER